MTNFLKKYKIYFPLFLLLVCSQHLTAQNDVQEIKKIRQKYGDLYSQYQREGKTDSILYIAQKFYPIAQRSGNDSIKMQSYNLLANAYNGMGDYASSLEYYLKFLSSAEKLKDERRVATAYENSSWAFYQLGNYQKGMEYGKKAVALFRSIPKQQRNSNYYIGFANGLDNYALNQLMLNQPKKAEKSELEAIQILDKADFKDGVFFRSGIYTDLARVYVALKNDKMAESYCLKASELNEQYKMQQISAATNNVYADFLYKKGETKKAISIAKKGFEAAVETHDKFSAITLAGILQKSYDQKKNTDSAYHYSKMVIAYKDSAFNSQKMLEIQNLTFKRQNEEREAEIKKEKLEEERKQNLQNAAIAIGLIAFFVAYLLFSHSAKVGKRTIQFLGILSMLLVFEFLNLLLHPFIGEITHHQPFWMLLCMVAIAAILIPLHHRLEHWIVHQLSERNEKIRSKSSNKIDKEEL